MSAHTLTVGTVMVAAWGYDQTNIDYFVVVKATPKTVLLQQVASKEEYDPRLFLQGKSTPLLDQPIGKPFRCKPYEFNGKWRVRINSFTRAGVWSGDPQNFSSYA